MSRHSRATSSRPRLEIWLWRRLWCSHVLCSRLWVLPETCQSSQFKWIPAVWNDENNNFLSNVLPCASYTMFWICSQRSELAKVLTHTATSTARAKMSSGKHNCYNQRTQESQRRHRWLYWTGRLSVLHDESPRPTNARVWMDGKWSRSSSLLGSISLV